MSDSTSLSKEPVKAPPRTCLIEAVIRLPLSSAALQLTKTPDWVKVKVSKVKAA